MSDRGRAGGFRGRGGGYSGETQRGGRSRGDRGGRGGGQQGNRGRGSGYIGDRGGGYSRGHSDRGGGYRGGGQFSGARGRQGSDFSGPTQQAEFETVNTNKPIVEKLAPLGFLETNELVPPASLPPIKSITGTTAINLIANTLTVEISKPAWAREICKYSLNFEKLGGGRSGASSRGGARGRTGKGGGAVGRGTVDAPANVPDKVRGKLIKYLLGLWSQTFKQPMFTDFKKFLITYFPLKLSVPNPINVKMNEIGDEEEISNTAEYTVEISDLTSPQKIPFTPLLERFLKNPQQFMVDEPENMVNLPTTVDDLTQIFNIAMRTNAVKQSIGNPASNMIILPDVKENEGSLVQWSGTSLRFTFGWQGFNTVNVSAVIIGQPVFDALNDLWAKNERSHSDPRDANTVNTRDLETANTFLVDCKVEYMRQGNKRKKSVRRVLSIGAQSKTFPVENGVSNVFEYFTTTLNQRLVFPDGICLDLGNNCVVPAEACKIVRGQVLSKKVSDAQEPLPKAAQRLEKIQNNISMLNLKDDQALMHCGINVAGELLELETIRVLPTPSLIYGSNDASHQIEITPPQEGTRAGTWDMWKANAKFHEPAEGQGQTKEIIWSIINIASRARFENADANAADEFAKSLKLVLESGGLNIHAYSGYEEIDSSRGNYGVILENMLNQAKQNNHDFVLVIMSGKDQYGRIKTIAETQQRKIGLLTQCVYGKNVMKDLKKPIGIVQNIALKLNQKLGGTNYWVKLDRTWERVDVLREPVLIIGADVTHPEKGSTFPSFAAVTGSTDRTGMPYQVKIIVQENAQAGSAAEVIHGMAEIVKEFIQRFIQGTGHKPRKIFYYRDGVGDSQFGEVLQEEMLQIRAGCEMALRDGLLTDELCWKDVKLGESINNMRAYEPKITFLTVQKRHKVRFFWKQQNGYIGNVPPGTLVDTIVVNPKMTNFYLASHIGIQGTTIPTHYQILWDDSEFQREELVILTYYLCFMFCRCTRSVSYPAPTYYSHLAASRAKLFATSLGSNYDYSNLMDLRRRIERDAGLLEAFPMHFV